MASVAADMLAYEIHLWNAGYKYVAGVDEVGRGALAGPLVAGAVILPPDIRDWLASSPMWNVVRDSKTLSAETRFGLARGIRSEAAAVGIGVIPAKDLDAIGLGAANRLAMEFAVADLDPVPGALLIDAMTIDTGIDQIGIIDGDARSLSIAAASIIAKVYRDELMVSLDAPDPRYGFSSHKGYGVPSHVTAIFEHGPCAHHRTSFAPVRRALERQLVR